MDKDLEVKRELIISHYETPINKIEETDLKKVDKYIKANINSTSCIDNINAYLLIKKKKIIDAKFSGVGCAICTSSTDIFCQLIKNKTINDVKEIIKQYFAMILGQKFNDKNLKDLLIFSDIHKQANRIQCAKIGIAAFNEALDK
jgi:nitrogen fixation NifU-like protein